MSIGALIFAYNNDQIDYLSMARWSARNINRHLHIPTAIVTNQPFVEQEHEQCILARAEGNNQRWFGDYNTNVNWYNKNRVDAYELSPWNQTLVIDADYVVASDQLKTILDSTEDFLAHSHAYDITGSNDFSGLNVFGNYNMPMWWATVMMFRRNQHAKLIIDAMTMIRNNWGHYINLFKFSRHSYRNDYALSIALGIVNGHTLNHNSIPWNLASALPEHLISQTGTDTYRVEFKNTNNQSRYIEICNQDFHAMGKKQLGVIVANNS
jgi:hypothetical protein